MRKLLVILCLWASFCQAKSHPADASPAALYVQTLKKLSDVMVIDATGPCASARYFAYANLAAYEILYQQSHPGNFVAFSGLLRDYPSISPPTAFIAVEFASLYALLRMGEALLPSGQLLEAARNQLVRQAPKKYRLSPEACQTAMAYADEVVKQLVQYATKDGYLKTSGYMRYTPLKHPGAWQPTPPGYMEAYESHWGTLRPFLLDSASQFRPRPPVAYDAHPGTPFQALAREVYDVTTRLNDEQKRIASFWDCNPFLLIQQGHVSYGNKRLSPAGHWMGITGIACQQQQLSLAETVRWHTLVGITMTDAFISCWKEKYQSNRVRPETFINAFMDPDWRPLLQTPPFPEYTSGHSVVSAAVAGLLTALAGDTFAFTDTVEMEFGLPARSFSSFQAAAREAAISRLYGGIHFRDAVENGYGQGEQIGQYILQKLQIKQ